ncbi:hypothetical protein [uncultured Rikenella sp.]|uniref:hypothetical protein n=1 Tax=uncultured Rikenella sp. TaxID=368003 RepID=UPI00262A3021|nr:hypothetical protein [uncultured Rikenella sp.]
MKKILCYLSIAVFGWLCSSCFLWTKGPNAYEDEICDAVTFHLAEADYIIEIASNPFAGIFLGDDFFGSLFSKGLEKMESAFNDLYVNTDMSYVEILESVSQDETSDFQKQAEDILIHYNQINISLSDYEQVSRRSREKSWIFTELHSGVEFIFTLEKDQSGQTVFSVTPVDNSIQDYVLNSL